MRHLFLACVLTVSFSAFTGEPDQAAIMAKFEAGKEHAELKKLEGKYDVAVKMWMDPAAPPQESKAAAEFKMELNGKFIKQDYKGEVMGKKFNGVGYNGFDRTLNKYVSIWLDDFGTQAMLLHGESKDGGKTIEYSGECGCPMESKMVKIRSVHKQIDADKFTFEMFETRDGKENKGMELTYTRKK